MSPCLEVRVLQLSSDCEAPMKVIVVPKVPKIRELQISGDLNKLERKSDPALERLLAAEQAQEESDEHVISLLEEMGIEYSLMFREDFETFGPGDSDVVITIGGDGTMLDVSHQIRNTLILGLNSDPERSQGYFTACHALSSETKQHLIWIHEFIHLKNRFSNALVRSAVVQLQRFRPVIDGEKFGHACMNDLLVTNRHPATMSRYDFFSGTKTERHASSGMWISTAAGSTAAIRSAGGSVMPLSQDWVQYVVREPYDLGDARFPLQKGVVNPNDTFRVKSLMDGAIYMDGPFIEIPFPTGTELEIIPAEPLRVWGMNPAKREL